MKKNIQKKVFAYLIFFFILSIFIISYSLLLYFNKLSPELRSFNNVSFIIGVISFFILGFLCANVAQKNGLLEGLLAALIILFVILLTNLFFKVPFVLKSFVKIVSYLFSASLGGILGVNFKSFV